MKALSDLEKKQKYGSGITSLLLYTSLAVATTNSIKLDKENQELKNDENILQDEIDSLNQSVDINVPFFYQT